MIASAPDEVPGLGTYGLRVSGLAGAERWMQPVPASAATLHVHVTSARPDASPTRVDEREANIALIGGGRLLARRDEATVTFATAAELSPDELLHPYLAPAAALTWQWRGREALHAGALAIGEGAVLLLGDKEAGKSTTLAWLATRRSAIVLSDDLAVVVDGSVFAGPRSLDLRVPDAAGAGELPVVRGGDRVRLALGSAPLALPVAGVVVLAWGPRLEVRPVPVADRLGVLARQRSFPGLPASGTELLDVAALPMVTVVRPRDAADVQATAVAILERFGA